jgi:ABC-type nitrate/sulfonate/bicarbonate transport system permease component
MKRWHENPTLRRAVALILLLMLWETASDLKWINPFYASSPSAVAKVLFSLFADGQIWPHLEATFFGGGHRARRRSCDRHCARFRRRV